MILPIVAYGTSFLRQIAKNIEPDFPQLKQLVADMWETLKDSNGVGLAAPQVNESLRLFIVDSTLIFARKDENKKEDEEDKPNFPDAPGIKRVFINAKITSRTGKEWAYNEGCLSLPQIHEDVFRPENVVIEYVDEDFQPHVETFNGVTARIIQHEYDHLDGKLFIDYLKPLKKKLLQRRLNDISKGNIEVKYKMLFPKK
jgi:peptide deformylase